MADQCGHGRWTAVLQTDGGCGARWHRHGMVCRHGMVAPSFRPAGGAYLMSGLEFRVESGLPGNCIMRRTRDPLQAGLRAVVPTHPPFHSFP